MFPPRSRRLPYSLFPRRHTSPGPDSATDSHGLSAGYIRAQMSILEKLIGLGRVDVTETAWWTETVFRELSRGDHDLPNAGSGVASDRPAVQDAIDAGSC